MSRYNLDIPQDVRESLEKEAMEQHRSLAGQINWVLEQHTKKPVKRERANGD